MSDILNFYRHRPATAPLRAAKARFRPREVCFREGLVEGDRSSARLSLMGSSQGGPEHVWLAVTSSRRGHGKFGLMELSAAQARELARGLMEAADIVDPAETTTDGGGR